MATEEKAAAYRRERAQENGIIRKRFEEKENLNKKRELQNNRNVVFVKKNVVLPR